MSTPRPPLRLLLLCRPLCLLLLCLLLLCAPCAVAGLALAPGWHIGRVSEGQYEFAELNGWLTPR